jgi:hypothetical protein
MPLASFWITDGGNKFIQVRNFDQYGEFAIHYPAADIDPEYKFFPYCGHHFKRVDDRIYSFYPFYFPLISFPFYKIFGLAGLYFIPLISSMLTLGCLFFILRRLGLEKYFPLAALFFSFASPMFFYSVVFWEMSLAVLFFSIGALLTVNALKTEGRRTLNFIFAGIFLGLCSIFREEGYLLFAALVFSCLIYMKGDRKKLLWILAGWLLMMLPLWVFQYFYYGHILGLHAAGYNSLDKSAGVAGKLRNFYVYLFKGAAFALFPALFCAVLKNKVLKFFAIPCLPLICVLFLWEALGAFSASSSVWNTLGTQVLFLQSPFLFLLIISNRILFDSPNRAVKFSYLLCLTYLFTACLSLNRSDIGIIWGPRHFLFLYPLFIPLAFYAMRNLFKLFRRSRILKYPAFAGVAFLFAASLCIQFHGIKTLGLKKYGSEKLINGLKAAEPDVILSDIYWLPEEAATIYFDKKFMAITGKTSITEAVRSLKNKGVGKFALVLSEAYRDIDNRDMKQAMNSVNIISLEVLTPPKMNFMEIHILTCEIKK